MADDKIELRSEKVRHIIGEIPSRIVRYGITVITIVVLILLVGAYFIPYPETVGAITVPYQYVGTLEKGMSVGIELEGYDTETYGPTNGTIAEISPTPRQTQDGNVFTAEVCIKECKYNPMGGMTGTASILVSNGSVLQRILRRMASAI